MPIPEYGYHALCEDALFLHETYPFLNVGRIGTSLCGRTLFCLSIGEGTRAILYAGAFHGMERITTALLMRFLSRLSAHYAENTSFGALQHVRSFFQACRLYIVPCVNPDGVEVSITGPSRAGAYASFIKARSGGTTAHWQANARGVDLNHNFNAGWQALRQLEIQQGYLCPGPTRFGGFLPESEPETIALTDFCRQTPLCHALAFHSQGEEIYYDYGEKTPDCALSMAKRLAAASGYQLSQPEEIASMGGFKDWVIACLQIPAFTIEIGKGKNPLPAEQLETIYPQLEPMLIEGLFL